MKKNGQPTAEEVESIRRQINEKMDSLGRKIMKSGLYKKEKTIVVTE